MTETIALVTGGLRGLGRGMTLGLLRAGYAVAAIGHIETDAAELHRLAGSATDRLLPIIADLRQAAACDQVLTATRAWRGDPAILVNNAGLTFTYTDPERFRRGTRARFWEMTDEIIQNVIDTNYVAADRMARRAAPAMLRAGWGRIVNVTTKLDTMNRDGSSPYGPSKAALEMATEIWAKELDGTGVTANIVNPGAGANTPGMAQEVRTWSEAGSVPRLVEPDDMVGPLLFVVSRDADPVNGFRFDANNWFGPGRAAEVARPAGFNLYPPGGWPREDLR